jgi:hypothetical protein
MCCLFHSLVLLPPSKKDVLILPNLYYLDVFLYVDIYSLRSVLVYIIEKIDKLVLHLLVLVK